GYNKAIVACKTFDEKLRVIVKYIYQFEHLHPFSDANLRTFGILLLNRLLLQNGFPPVAFYDPNCIDGYSMEQLLTEIKFSMQMSVGIAQYKAGIFEFNTSDILLENRKIWTDIVSDFRHTLEHDTKKFD